MTHTSTKTPLHQLPAGSRFYWNAALFVVSHSTADGRISAFPIHHHPDGRESYGSPQLFPSIAVVHYV